MRNLARFALATGAAALFAGCGGSQPPIGAPGPMPQSHEIAPHADRRGSWMLPEATRDLLYVLLLNYGSSGYTGLVQVYTFPGRKLVGELTGFSYPYNLCSDKSGNVWIMDYGGDYQTMLHEYAHGSDQEIATLTDIDGSGEACAVDPVTGNLAVANWYDDIDYFADVLIYPNAQYPPAKYAMKTIDRPYSATYDNAGDLFVSGQLAVYDAGTDELENGQSSFERFKPKPYTRPHVGSEWGGGYLTAIAHPDLIHRYQIAVIFT